MKAILKSLVVIGLIGGLAIGATRAFFSDVETSRANVFSAGKIDLKIDYQGYYNKLADGNPNAGNWSFGNLVNEKFFNFSDVKPGDYGEGTISLHVYDNDAWACLTIGNMVNNDNSCPEPEDEVDEPGVVGCGSDPGAGELAQNLYFFAWADDGDNVWEDGELPLFSNIYGPASDVLAGRTYVLADSTTAGPIIASVTRYIGIQWCAGTMTVDVLNEKITCGGAGMGNDTQTDSVTADISFYVEQWKNNPTFTCGSRQIPTLTPTPTP